LLGSFFDRFFIRPTTQRGQSIAALCGRVNRGGFRDNPKATKKTAPAQLHWSRQIPVPPGKFSWHRNGKSALFGTKRRYAAVNHSPKRVQRQAARSFWQAKQAPGEFSSAADCCMIRESTFIATTVHPLVSF
jgi:hypothetical protein